MDIKNTNWTGVEMTRHDNAEGYLYVKCSRIPNTEDNNTFICKAKIEFGKSIHVPYLNDIFMTKKIDPNRILDLPNHVDSTEIVAGYIKFCQCYDHFGSFMNAKPDLEILHDDIISKYHIHNLNAKIKYIQNPKEYIEKGLDRTRLCEYDRDRIPVSFSKLDTTKNNNACFTFTASKNLTNSEIDKMTISKLGNQQFFRYFFT